MEFGTKRDQGGPGYFKPFAGDGVAVKLYAMWWYNQGGGQPHAMSYPVCVRL